MIKWIEEDLGRNKVLNEIQNVDETKAKDRTCWLFMIDDDYYITDTDCQVLAKLNESLSIIDNEACVEISIQSYLYTAHFKRQPKREPCILMLISQYEVKGKKLSKISDKFDLNSLRKCYHRDLKLIEKMFIIDDDILSETSETSDLLSETSRIQDTTGFSSIVGDLSLGSMKDFTIELAQIEKEKKIEEDKKLNKQILTNKKNLNEAFASSHLTAAPSQEMTKISVIGKEQTANSELFDITNSAQPANMCSSQLDKNEITHLPPDLSKIISDEKNSRRSKSQIIIEKITPQTKIALSQLDDDVRVIESQPGISTQIDLNSNETCKSELNRKFKPISPIKDQSQKQKTELSTVQEASTKDELMSDDDDSIDAIWIDKNEVVKETQASQVNPKNITYDIKSPLARRSRFGSSNSSVISMGSTENSFNDEPSFKRKRKKIFQKLISNEFEQGELDESPERPSSHGDFSSSSSTSSSTPATCVIECCSQSLIFAPKEKQILGERRAKRAFSECKPVCNRKEAAKLFSPQEKRSASTNDKREKFMLTSEVLRSNNCKISEAYLKSPSLCENSKLIDDILTKSENEKVTKRRRRKLFHDSFNSVINALKGDDDDESFDEEDIKKSLLNETKGAFKASQMRSMVQQQKVRSFAEPLVEVNEKSEHENSDPKSNGTNLSDKSIPRAQDPAQRNNKIKNSNETTTNSSETSSAEQNRSLVMKTAITNFAQDFEADSVQKYLLEKMPAQ